MTLKCCFNIFIFFKKNKIRKSLDASKHTVSGELEHLLCKSLHCGSQPVGCEPLGAETCLCVLLKFRNAERMLIV